MRVFVVSDEEGNIVSVGQVEEMSEGVDRPVHVGNPKHSVVELERDDEAFKAVATDRSEDKKKGLLKVHSEYSVETKRGGGKGLVKKEGRPIIDKSPSPGPAPPDRTPQPAPDRTPAPADPKRPVLKNDPDNPPGPFDPTPRRPVEK